jgi:hypothetical protein
MPQATVIPGNSLASAHPSLDVQTRPVATPAGSGTAARTAAEPAIAAARAAANGNTAATNPYAIRNPLWVIVIGMAVFFAVAASVTALN